MHKKFSHFISLLKSMKIQYWKLVETKLPKYQMPKVHEFF
jgi:hypothetical protein